MADFCLSWQQHSHSHTSKKRMQLRTIFLRWPCPTGDCKELA